MTNVGRDEHPSTQMGPVVLVIWAGFCFVNGISVETWRAFLPHFFPSGSLISLSLTTFSAYLLSKAMRGHQFSSHDRWRIYSSLSDATVALFSK